MAETQVATFECEVSHFNVPSTWLRDGVEIEMSEKFRIVVQGKLHQLKIMNTSKDDSAEYTFICGNDRVSATLTVSRKFTLHLRGSGELPPSMFFWAFPLVQHQQNQRESIKKSNIIVLK